VWTLFRHHVKWYKSVQQWNWQNAEIAQFKYNMLNTETQVNGETLYFILESSTDSYL